MIISFRIQKSRKQMNKVSARYLQGYGQLSLAGYLPCKLIVAAAVATKKKQANKKQLS